MTTIFVSYRRDDSAAYAGRLCDRLVAQFGKDQVFMDVDHIEPGEDFAEVIASRIGTADAVLVLIGPHWLSLVDSSGTRRLDDPDDFVRLEVSAALDKQIRVIPVLVGGAGMPAAQDLPAPLRQLARRQALEISDTRFHIDADRLIAALLRVLEPARTAVQSTAAPAVSEPSHTSPQQCQPASVPAAAPATQRHVSTTWRDGLLTIEETFTQGEREEAALLTRFTLQTLADKGWEAERVVPAEFAITELIDNAFVHALAVSHGKVSVKVAITDAGCTVTVTDDGPGFDLRDELRRQCESGTPEGVRGLCQIDNLMALTQLNPNTLQVRMQRVVGKFEQTTSDGVLFLAYDGRMDMATADDFRNKSLPCVRTAAEAGCNLAIDFSRISYISSAGLRVMMLIAKEAKMMKLKLVAFAIQPLIWEMFQISRFDKVLPTVATKEDAIAYLRTRETR